MKRLLTLVLLLCVIMRASAYEWTDGNDVTWTFSIDGRDATITKASKNTGDLIIPSKVYTYDTEYRVTSIGDKAFFGYGLTSVTISNGITTIGDEAFYGQLLLNSVDIPSSVAYIGQRAFYGCSKLTIVNIHDLAAWCDIIFNGWFSNPLLSGGRLHLNGEEINDLVIPDGVTNIRDYCFIAARNYYSVTIPKGVKTIGKESFSGCSMAFIDIPSSVTSIGENAFYDCTNLFSVNIHDIAAWCKTAFYSEYSNPLFYSWYLYLNGEEVTNLVIPESVTSISNYAFYNCWDLKGVTIPNSVTSIGYRAFYGCSGLTSVTIPNSVTSIGGGAFEYCSRLTSVTIPSSVTTIPSYAFYNCSGLTSVTIPASVTSIGGYAFDGCEGLTKVIVPDIAAWCAISFDNFVANPLWYAHHLYLDENTEITALVIPEGVTSIGYRAFYGCSGLTSVTIPSSVKSIGHHVFSLCDSLNRVDSYIITPFEISDDVFKIMDLETLHLVFTSATLYVPAGTKEKYKAAEGWKYFKRIVERGVEDGIEPATAPVAEVTATGIYDTNGKQLPAIRPGINIIRYSDGTTRKVVTK